MRFVATALVALVLVAQALAGEDFYALLGVKRNANLRDIKKGTRAGRFANRSEAGQGGAADRRRGATEGQRSGGRRRRGQEGGGT